MNEADFTKLQLRVSQLEQLCAEMDQRMQEPDADDAAQAVELAKLQLRVGYLEQENAELAERMVQMVGANDALNLRLTEVLTAERAAPQITLSPSVNVAAPQVVMPNDKSASWEMSLPSMNGAPSRTVTIKRTA